MKTKPRNRIGTIITVLAVTTAAFGIVYSSGLPEQRDSEHDRERRVVVRWKVTTTRPAHVVVLSESSLFGSQVITETTASGDLAGDIQLVKNESRLITAAGELPVASSRGSITCQLLVNGKIVVRQTRTVRAGERANAVTCQRRVTG